MEDPAAARSNFCFNRGMFPNRINYNKYWSVTIMEGAARSLRSMFPLLVLCLLAVPMLPAAADDTWTVYDPDLHHPWNRVFRVLYDMTPSASGTGPSPGYRAHWPESLVNGERHRQVLAALDDFLNNRAERRFRDPVRRALFQNDLWKVFAWTVRDGTTDEDAARVALQTRLVRVMRRVALTRAEIERLPDTYASAVGANAHPASYDPQRRQQSFLPPDLWTEKGPWVLLGNNRDYKPAAILHAQQLGATSDFFVLLWHPKGRTFTVRWLDQLGVLGYNQARRNIAYLKREGVLPSFVPLPEPIDDAQMEKWLLSSMDAGIRVALVRQMRVVDAAGYDYPTRLVERVQIRVYRDPKLPPQYPPAPTGTEFQLTQEPIGQDVFMFRLDRQALAAGRASSLRPVEIGEYTRNANFINGNPPPDEIHPVGSRPGANAYVQRVLDSCVMCHTAPGVFSFMTFARAPMAGDSPPRLHEQRRDSEEGTGRRLNAHALG